MIVCQQCESEYPDGAQWCNHCEMALERGNSAQLFDQQALASEQYADRKARDLAFKVMLVMALMAPLLAAQKALTSAAVPITQLVLLVASSLLAAIACWAIAQQRQWSRSLAIASAIPALFVFPSGTAVAVMLLLFLFAGPWHGQ